MSPVPVFLLLFAAITSNQIDSVHSSSSCESLYLKCEKLSINVHQKCQNMPNRKPVSVSISKPKSSSACSNSNPNVPKPNQPVPQIVRSAVASDADLETLKLVQIFFRHGDRSPLRDFPTNPVNISQTWPKGLGQLTTKGKARAHELGQFLRKRYAGFVSNEFQPKEIYIRSSDFDRTIMSAETVLSGLYLTAGKTWDPKINWDPTPLRTIPSTADNIVAFTRRCPAFKKELDTVVGTIGKAWDDKHRMCFDFIANQTGLAKVNFEEVSEIYDTLFIQSQEGFPLPDWAAKPCPGEEPLLMRQTAEFVFYLLTSTPKLKKLRGGPLLREIVRNMDEYREKVKGQNGKESVQRKVVMYSGHDSTLAVLLQILGVYERRLVPYSAAVIVELHKPVSGPPEPISSNACDNPVTKLANVPRSDDYYIKIIYRNCSDTPPLELFIPDCEADPPKPSNSTSNNNNDPISQSPALGSCPLTKFRKLKRSLLTGNWKTDCFLGVGPDYDLGDWCSNGKDRFRDPGVHQQTVSVFERFLKLLDLFLSPFVEFISECSWNTFWAFFDTSSSSNVSNKLCPQQEGQQTKLLKSKSEVARPKKCCNCK